MVSVLFTRQGFDRLSIPVAISNQCQISLIDASMHFLLPRRIYQIYLRTAGMQISNYADLTLSNQVLSYALVLLGSHGTM